MKKSVFYIYLFCFLYSCGTDKLIDETPKIELNAGLVINIPFDSSCVELISGQVGIPNKVTYATNRKGVSNKAAYFNRLDSAIVNFGDLNSATFSNQIVSVSCWVNLEDTTKPCAIMSKRSATGGFEYSIDNHFREKQFFNFDNWIEDGTSTVYGIDPLNASAPISLNAWQHLVYIANGNVLTVYVNGVLQNGIDAKNNNKWWTNTVQPFVVGNGGGYGKNYYFQGAIDDIKIYNRVLNNSEISALYKE